MQWLIILILFIFLLNPSSCRFGDVTDAGNVSAVNETLQNITFHNASSQNASSQNETSMIYNLDHLAGGIIAGDWIDDTIYIFRNWKAKPSATLPFQTKTDPVILESDLRQRINIFHPKQNWDNENSVLWSWNARLDDGIPQDLAKYFDNPNDAKRLVNGTHILIACAGDGVAKIRVRDAKVDWFAIPGGSPHSAEILPGGVIVVANTKRGKKAAGSIQVYSTQEGSRSGVSKNINYTLPLPTQIINFQSCHGVVWDRRRQRLWVVGGRTLSSFSYNNDPYHPQLKMRKTYPIEASGHDLFPIPGSSKKLFYTSKNVWIVNVENGKQRKLLDKGGVKGVTQNGPGGELLYMKAKGMGRLKWTNEWIRSLGGPDRRKVGAGFYKIRWFVPNSFSYEEEDWKR